MSFFDEQIQRIQTEVARQKSRNDIDRTVRAAATALIPAAEARIERAKSKIFTAQLELESAQQAFQNLLNAQTCKHEFIDAGGGMMGPFLERCTKCNWVHHC